MLHVIYMKKLAGVERANIVFVTRASLYFVAIDKLIMLPLG